jgi:hypothetical protein
LYELYLMDVQTGSCLKTTRLLQATGAVQLYVQRILLNLEYAAPPLDKHHRELWDWMHNYRVWEANRKVFLFPENWLLPELRDDRTAICPATLIAELGDQRDRYPTAAAMLADAGQSPVAVESGKRKVACFRRACDKRLRNAVTTLADSTRHWHPWAHQIYTNARDRGHNHQRAIRTLGAAWLRVLWRCWHNHTSYNPTRHGALTRQLARAG